MMFYSVGDNRFEVREDEVNRGFSEQGPAKFDCAAPGCKLFIDDIELPSRLEAGVTSWVWTPGFFAGTVLAELIVGGSQSSRRFLLDVAPRPDKLGQDAFKTMVADVWEVAPELIVGTEPARHEIGRGGHAVKPAIRLARIMSHAKDFIRAMDLVSAEPHRQMVASRALVQPAKCRKVDRQTVQAALVSGSLGLQLAQQGQRKSTAKQVLFDVPVSMETQDTPANQTLAAFLSRLQAMTLALTRRLAMEVECEVEEATRTSLAIRWPRRRAFLEGFSRALSACRNAAPVRFVKRSQISAAGLIVLSTNPRYARALQLATAMLRPGFEGPLTREMAWMSPTWGIYEAWCYVRLRAWLLEAFAGASWRDRSLPGCDGCFEGTVGKTRVALYYQPRFPSGARLEMEMASLSCELRPDIILVVDSPKGVQWIALDAKYRVAKGSVLEGMSSAHIYHDALRVRGTQPKLSLLLVPGDPVGVGWLMDTSFHNSHGIGVHVLASDCLELSWLSAWLAGLVK